MIMTPLIGFGTWKLKNNSDTTEIIVNALESGYTMFDTASSYQNEEAIGEAFKDVLNNNKKSREDLFISGKLWNSDRQRVAEACDSTLKNLGCDYLDCYLMHWPASKALYENWAEINVEVWSKMEELVKAGKVKNIGVSNFKKNQLESLLSSCSIKPFTDQIEYHPGFTQAEIIDFCKQEGISVQAWSPLRSGRALKKKEIVSVAEKYSLSPAQIILKWCIQNGLTPIVKSKNPERMKLNLELDFTLAKEDMDYLNSLPYLGSSGLDSETLTLFG